MVLHSKILNPLSRDLIIPWSCNLILPQFSRGAGAMCKFVCLCVCVGGGGIQNEFMNYLLRTARRHDILTSKLLRKRFTSGLCINERLGQ